MSREGTPIESVCGISPKTGKLLRAIGVDTLEALQGKGWQEVFERLVSVFPETLDIDVALSLVGAIHQISHSALSSEQKREAKSFVKGLRRQSG